MNQVYEYDCRESAEAALARIESTSQVAVWSSDQLETRLAKLHKEMTTLKVILAAWRLAEQQRKAETAQAPIMEETTTETTTQAQNA